ncbi:hypothetical protein [Geitlerinema sp. PCC 7407]|uniref:hypothetical protein n=1 Tax=Geitlerinema sp. PCC 7407 TaxID=1173025 RepID=UPI00029FCCEB|nr:hypothetical protein [Geitlerinema sp. PCC 7407]AFY67207.1 hypothetical protein GEI7407_2734 [Geitlerinema sp. PCC 7407]
MSPEPSSQRTHLPAPCIVDVGTVVHKRDMQRLLADLGRVRYVYQQDGAIASEGEACILEVFADSQQATLIANQSIYLNTHSFDYLEMGRSPDGSAYFDLIQDNRQLRLIPLHNPFQEPGCRPLSTAALEAVVADVLSANWDAQIDDEENFS